MADMVERVARALHESMSQQDIMGYLDAKIDAEVLARAAIEAMREPTEAMKLAGEVPIINSGSQDDAWSLSQGTYRAMIDAALASERKP